MRILYVTTVSGTINSFLVPHIKMLIEQGHKVDIACNITQPITEELLEQNCEVFNFEFQRSPIKFKNYIAYIKLKKLLKERKYDIVHTHTPVASFLTRLACRSVKNIKVFYTAHGFHFYKGTPKKNWLLYYPIEKYLSRYTDVLITINQEDYNLANKFFKAKKLEYVPGVGIDPTKFNDVVVDITTKRKELSVPENSFVLLSVGELNKNKNHETIIKALAKLKNPNIYYLICGKGPLENYLVNLSKKHGLEKQVKLLGYRKDIPEIFKIVDVFVFPSFREGLSLALMEAMQSGLPIICSNIRGNRDLIENNKGGYLIDPSDADAFAKKIINIMNEDHKKMSLHNSEVIKKFYLNNVIERLKEIYSRL